VQENPNLQKLRKRKRTRHSKKKVEGKEGDGEWLGGDDMEEVEEETYEETEFNLNSYLRRFANFQVVGAYVWLIGRFKHNSQATNHQV
jgi:hypothetical protein